MYTGTAPVERHHVFGGPCKAASEKYGFIAPLAPHLHPNGVRAGKYATEADKDLKKRCYEYYISNIGTQQDFIREFIRVPE